MPAPPLPPHWPTVAAEILKSADGCREHGGRGLQHEDGDLAVAAALIVLQTLGRALTRGLEAADAHAASGNSEPG